MTRKRHAEHHQPLGGNRRGEQLLRYQGSWLACCLAFGEHRFDCADVPAQLRGAGPFLPRRASTPAELVEPMRSEP